MTRARVLLVEDDPTFRRYVCLALDDMPVDIVEVETIHAARQALAEGRFALLITDLTLADGDGLELLTYLQAEPAARGDARIVVLSGGISAATARRAITLGASRILDKPVSMRTLADCALQVLGDALKVPPPPRCAAARATAIEARFAGDADLFDAFEAASLARFPADLDAGDAACRDHDRAALRRQAHNLKSVLALLGADAASSQARLLEAAAADGGADGIADLVPLWQALRAAVRALH